MDRHFPFKEVGEQVVLYENNGFAVASGYDSRDERNKNGANFLSVGVLWFEDKSIGTTNYPVGKDGKVQWFRLCDELAPSFLDSLLGKKPQNDSKIAEAIQTLKNQISQRS